jgi:uncharacterized protein YydD (DUF2326 family)
MKMGVARLYLKTLKIENNSYIIREINFRKGLNLIVDETSIIENGLDTKTGNNVGKTTVLKLIDFCLGADPEIIYSDLETNKTKYDFVRNFLIDNNILITLILEDQSNDKNNNFIIIERNFLKNQKNIRKINGIQYSDKNFTNKLEELFFPDFKLSRPTFRQIISHNIRYKDHNVNNILKTLDPHTKNIEYEALYLFLFGFPFENAEERNKLLVAIQNEKNFKNRISQNNTKSIYEISISILDKDIEQLNKQKENLNINENFRNDVDKLNEIKYELMKSANKLTNYEIRKNIILDAEKEMNDKISNIDINNLKNIYSQAGQFIENLNKSFEEVLNFHNEMLEEKIRFITKELPSLNNSIETENKIINKLIEEEKIIAEIVSKSSTYEDLEKIVEELNKKYLQKGEHENILSQIVETEKNLDAYNKNLEFLSENIYSKDFEDKIRNKIRIFNDIFSSISYYLYNERYILGVDIVDKKSIKSYEFSSSNLNLSSGKKQGEILCFDMAYIIFAEKENMKCIHFLLNDKKELMHDNQLIKLKEFLVGRDMQVIISILSDKLPEELKDEKFFIVKLSQDNKLFRIENKK